MSTTAAARVAFRDEFDVFIIGEEAALIRSDTAEHLLSGTLHARLTPLLSEGIAPDDAADALSDHHPPEEVYFAIERLSARGWLRDAPKSNAPPPLLDTPRLAALNARLQGRDMRIALRTCDGIDAGSWAHALRGAGIDLDPDAALTLVLVRDYLDDAIAGWNRSALAEHRPWLIASPGAGLVWAGPTFVPGETACWLCTAHQLRRNRASDAFLRLHARRVPRPPRTFGTQSTDLDAIAHILARVVGVLAGNGPRDAIVRYAPSTDSRMNHSVWRRPQCPACGDASAYTRQAATPVALTARRRHHLDGGYRTVSAADTLGRLLPLLDPLTGVVPKLERIGDDDSPSPVYIAGSNGARPWRSLAGLRRGLRSHSSGKGLSDAQARVSALAEHVERYSGIFQGDEPRVRASFEKLADDAIHPDACQLFSERQFRSAVRSADTRSLVPARFDPSHVIDWTPVTSLTHGATRFVPTALLYYDAPDPDGFFVPDSNGAAAGNTLEEAVLQGLLELVERDAAGIWWYGRHARPSLDWRALDDPQIDAFVARLERTGREVWLLDLMTDIDIPVVAAVSRSITHSPEAPLIGLGCHLDAAIAVGRALSELGQMHAAAATVSADPADPLRHWLSGATIAEHPYIGARLPDVEPARHPRAGPTGDLLADIETCRKRIERVGLEVLVLDQTRPDVGFAVAKVVVPGLRHVRPRFAPGRLYSVPLTAGWTERAPHEGELNPVPFFL